MKQKGFTPDGSKGKKTNAHRWLFLLSAMTLTGCITSQTPPPLAYQPPDTNFSISSIEAEPNSQTEQNYEAQVTTDMSLQALAAVQPASGVSGGPPVYLASFDHVMLKGKRDPDATPYNCRTKDRFDRKVLLAYEWDRSRLSVDVDGINLRQHDLEGVFVQYKLRIQPEKPKKLDCRYPSNWQGLIGSGYNELIRREDAKVWKELNGLKRKVGSHLDNVF